LKIGIRSVTKFIAMDKILNDNNCRWP